MPTTSMPYSSATDYDSELKKLERKRAMAAALMAQGQQPMQGQMIGRVYVPPSFLQGAAGLAQTYAGTRQMKKADRAEGELTSQRNAMIAQALKDYQESGDPGALMTNQDTRDYGMKAQQSAIDAERKALADALSQRGKQEGEERLAHIRGSYQDEPLTFEQRKQLEELKRSGTGAGVEGYAPTIEWTTAGPVEMVRTPKGITPRVITDSEGKPFVRSQYDPGTQRDVNSAKAEGSELGKSGAEARLAIPEATATAQLVREQAQQLIGNAARDAQGRVVRDTKGEAPGLEGAVGSVQGYLPDWMVGLGSNDRSGFLQRVNQMKGGAFLNGRQMLKGGGAITDWESKRAEEAFSRMSRAQSEEDFTGAVLDFVTAVEAGAKKLEAKARAAGTGGPTEEVDY